MEYETINLVIYQKSCLFVSLLIIQLKIRREVWSDISTRLGCTDARRPCTPGQFSSYRIFLEPQISFQILDSNQKISKKCRHGHFSICLSAVQIHILWGFVPVRRWYRSWKVSFVVLLQFRVSLKNWPTMSVILFVNAIN